MLLTKWLPSDLVNIIFFPQRNLKLIHEHIRIFNKPPGDSKTADPTEETNESPGQHCGFPPGTCYPPDLPKELAETLKHQAFCRRKKDKPSKPALSAEKLEVVSHAPAILPKPSAVAFPLLSSPPHFPQLMNPCVSGIGALNCLSKVPPVEQNQGVPTQTLYSSVTALRSLETVPLQNALGAPMASSCAPKVAQIGSTQGKMVISFPPTVMTPQLSSHPGPVVTTSVAPNQGGLILTLPSPPVHSAFICPTPIIKTSASIPLGKGHVSQHHGKLTPSQYQISPKPLSQIIFLPSGYVFASNLKAKPRQIFKRVLAPKRTTMTPNRKKTTSDIVNTTSEPQGAPPETPSIQESVLNYREEKTAEEELACDGVEMENEVEECDERDVRDLFLTLSESMFL